MMSGKSAGVAGRIVYAMVRNSAKGRCKRKRKEKTWSSLSFHGSLDDALLSEARIPHLSRPNAKRKVFASLTVESLP